MWSRLRVGRRPAGAALSALALLCALAPAASAVAPAESPQALAVLAADARFIDIAWDPPADSLLATELSVAQPPLPAFTEVLPPGQTEATIEVTCGHTYEIAVRLRNGLGETGPPASLSQASDPCSPGPPPAPTGVRVTGITGGSVNLAWDAPAANDIERIRLTTSPSGTAPAEDRAFYEEDRTIGGLVCGSTYTFTVVFVDYAGQQSSPASATATTVDCALVGPPLSPPTGLRLVGALGPVVEIAWDPPPEFDAVTTFRWTTPTRIETYGGASSPVTRTTAPCGAHVAEVSWRLADGRVSPPARLALAIPACPRPPRTSGITPYVSPPASTAPVAILLRLPAQRRAIAPTTAGRFTLRGAFVRCPPAGGDCALAVRVVHPRSRVVLGVLRAGVPQGARAPVTGRLSVAGRRALRRLGRLPVAIEVEAEQAVGNDAAEVRATLVAPRRRSGR